MGDQRITKGATIAGNDLSTGPLPRSKNPHFLSCENEFYLQEDEQSFPYQRLST